MVKVFLLDDHDVVRLGLRDLLSAEDDMEVVGEAATATDALERLVAVQPDVAILDVRLPDGNGVEVCREIRSINPQIRCLMLTSYADDEALVNAVMAGAAGYVLKQIRASDLVDSVRRVARGDSLLDPALTRKVMERIQARAEQESKLARLSDQERRILEQIATGKTNREIAQDMYLAEKTVKNYVSNLLLKLGMKRRTEAAAFAIRSELGQLPAE